MTRRRLLVVSDEMEVGGSQRQISLLLGGLDRSRWQPELLFFRNESHLVRQLRDLGITVHQLPKRGRFDPVFILRYAALLRRGRYDLVHAYSLTAEFWTAVARLMVWRAPLQVSSVRNLHLGKPAWFWAMKRFALRRSAAVISNARLAAATTAQHVRMRLDEFDIVPNGVLPVPPLGASARDLLRRALGVPAGRVFGLFVGRLVTQKNLPCLVRAMALIPEAQRPWLALAGDGPLRATIEQTIAEAGLAGDVRFLGKRSDAVLLMQAADFLVLPSLHEGLSNVLMEAMSVGCPVVASNVGGAAELIEHGRCGLLFPSDDANALARHLAALASDVSLRSRLSAACKVRIGSRYSIGQMVDATVAVYDRCLRAHPMGFKSAQAMLATRNLDGDA